MKNIDVELIHRVLDGDDIAFSELVKKYQRSVHALVWRKIGDFHIAEEITQDTFLKAYQGLATLKKPQSFVSWLYVIAANHCSTWLRKKRLQTQSLEETSSAQLEKATYSGYVIEENEQNLSRFQKPYSFDAMSEMTIELIEAPIVLNLASKPDVRNQFGNADAKNKNAKVNQRPDAPLFPSASGHILDEAGKPVSGIKIAVTPVVDGNGTWFPIRERNTPSSQAESDAEGHFTITSIIDGPVLLSLSPFHRSDVRILKVQIGESFFYPSGIHDRGIVFATSPGRRIENIKVMVQHPHIRGRVQYTDGTPIANTKVKLRLRTVSLYGNSSSDGGADTNAEGYFTYYAKRDSGGPTFYILSVGHQAQTVNAKPIILKPGDQTHDVVFTFETTPERPLPARHPGFARASASTTSSRAHNVWVVSPENGHAYKKIKCEDWEDAQAQAAAEGAYLVTINDKTEQKWLQVVFGGEPSWIGLNDIAQEGQWRWDNGEPVTYTNWGLQEPGDTSIGEEDYVIIGPSGKWKDFGPGHGGISLIRTALIEKENVPVKK